jgi:type IV pilus assembly protein PilC
VPITKEFTYETVGAGGKREKGKIEASNETAAAVQLRAQGLVPLSISENSSVLQKDLKIPGLSGRTTLKDLSVFSRQFATMSAAGMSLLRTLAVMEDQTEKASLKKAIGEVRLDVEGGMPLSAAMARHDRVFPSLMVAMVKSGETGGFLDDALERIAGSFEKDSALRGKIKSALTYPVMVLAFSVVMIAAVLIFIVPIFEKMFRDLGGELPLPTQIIVSASNTIAWSGPLTVVVVATVTTIFRGQLRRRPGLRLLVDKVKLKLPVFGPLFTKIAISRFSRNLGTLLSVGIPVMQALSVVGATTGNSVIAAVATAMQNSVREGRTMSAPLGQYPVFPRMVTQMMEVGEESGQISQMLGKIADFYDREVDDAAESLTAALEPIMVLFMGALIGGMVVCLYLPMFEVYQNIQGVE